jgi:hypothetical protein
MKIAKVIKIIDENSIVINRGSNDGVKINDVCLVFEIGEELFDPDSGESLGNLEYVKGNGKVTHVQDKISTVETNETKKTKKIRKPISTFSQFITPEEETYETELVPFKNLKIGDLVKKIR